MTLEALYFLAQIVAALAIVASLIFVGFQVRTSNREQRYSRKFDNFTIQNTVSDFIIDNGEVARIYIKGGTDFSSLTTDERSRFINMLVKTIRALDLIYEMHEAGDIDSDALVGFERMTYRAIGSPGGRTVWETTEIMSWLPQQTRKRIEALLAEGEAAGRHTVTDLGTLGKMHDDT